MKKLKFLSRIIFYVNILPGILLLGSYAAPYVNPRFFWPIAFLGLAFPYLLGANFVFLLYWIFRGKIKFLFPLIIILLGYKSLPNYFQLNLSNPEKIESEFKVLSFNVRIFDLYMWTKDKTTRKNIFEFLKKEDADIICLQEFYHSDTIVNNYEFNTLDSLIRILNTSNYHVEYTTNLRGTDHWGIITLSKYPIVGKGVVHFQYKSDNACIYTDIKRNKKTVRVYNTHLASIRLEKHDYKAIQGIYDNKPSQNFDKELMLIEKIRYGFEGRSSQADSILKSISESPFPVILCGDFNDTPSSYAYRTIRGNLQDAFVQSGSGLGRTYIGKFPSFRIDYILFSDELQSLKFITHPEELSDHHPISARFKFK